jgi:hypothetical protein
MCGMNFEIIKTKQWEQKYDPDPDFNWKSMYFYVFQRIQGWKEWFQNKNITIHLLFLVAMSLNAMDSVNFKNIIRSIGVHYHAVISPNFKNVLMKHPVLCDSEMIETGNLSMAILVHDLTFVRGNWKIVECYPLWNNYSTFNTANGIFMFLIMYSMNSYNKHSPG